jgi:hypothetical protein
LTESGRPQGDTQFATLVKRCLSVPPLDLTKRISLYSSIGLPLLYASAYFLPKLGSTGAYFLPSDDVLSLVVWPSLLAVAVGAAVVYVISSAARQWCTPRMATLGAVVLLSLLSLIALKGIVAASGYDWQDSIPRGQELLSSLRDFKMAVSIAVVLLVWAMRNSLPKLDRLLGSLGFALGGLAVIRIVLLWSGSEEIVVPPMAAASLSAQSARAGSAGADKAAMTAGGLPRRVVWILFDETDFDRLYAPNGAERLELPNFNRLAHTSVFATQANSPASATLYSIPALLTGSPIDGDGVRISSSGVLSLQRSGSRPIPFSEATSIFGALAATGRSASVLGFFHPYCKLFKLQRCDSYPFPEIGGLDAPLWVNIPDSISNRLRHVDYWEDITRSTLRLLPQYLARDDALTLVHFNVPHLPADYADDALHLPPSANPLTEYSRNLVLADQILGEIVQDLQRQASHWDLLLVVSTDHWLRNRWYQANERETTRPVPLIMWRVGDVNGHVLSQPVSTVHTAAMILDFLNGNLDSQADIAKWWANQPVYPSFIAPKT